MSDTFVADDYKGPNDFVHLHNHTVFSTLDGVATPEQYALQCAKRGYPAMSVTEHGHMGSVPDMFWAFKKHKVKMIAGCFLPGQPVLTPSGINRIDKILPGDYVLSASNTPRLVMNTQSRDYCGDVIRIRAFGVEDIVATPEHPFLVKEELANAQPTMMPLSEIAAAFSAGRCFYLCAPRSWSTGQGDLIFQIPGDARDVKVDDRFKLDSGLLWIIGLWLATGSADHCGLTFHLSMPGYYLYERISGYFAGSDIKVSYRFSTERPDFFVNVASPYFARLFNDTFMTPKRLPYAFLSRLTAEQLAALLTGVFDGGVRYCGAAPGLELDSQALAWQIRLLLARRAEYGAVVNVANRHDRYVLYRRSELPCDANYVFLPMIETRVEYYSGKVHNMEVAVENTYNVGVAVHNCEIYFNDYEPIRREHWQGKSLKPLKESDPESYFNFMRNRHLTLIAKNDVGFTNLVKLTTQAYKTGNYYKPRIWFDKLCEYKEGLIVLSGCLNGPVAHELRRINPDGSRAPRLESPDKRGAVDWVRKFKKVFGDDYYIEVQMPGIHDDDWVFRQLIALADFFKIEVILANDCHYLSRADFEIQKVMMAIDQKTTVDDPNLFHVNSDEQYMKTRAELWARFKSNGYSKGIPDSYFEKICDNTLKLAERCQTPTFDSKPKYPSLEHADDKLRELVVTQLVARRLHTNNRKYLIDGREVRYRDQMEIELKRIIDKGFASYFLITHDIISYGRRNHWPFSPRGSAGGSLVNYLLGISPIDPLKWGLSFDRFLSPSRGGFMLNVKMPEPVKEG